MNQPQIINRRRSKSRANRQFSAWVRLLNTPPVQTYEPTGPLYAFVLRPEGSPAPLSQSLSYSILSPRVLVVPTVQPLFLSWVTQTGGGVSTIQQDHGTFRFTFPGAVPLDMYGVQSTGFFPDQQFIRTIIASGFEIDWLLPILEPARLFGDVLFSLCTGSVTLYKSPIGETLIMLCSVSGALNSAPHSGGGSPH